METDLLGAPYERMPLVLEPDDEGEVVATLIRRRAAEPTSRAVLYVHGFVDYFFQTHLADFFVERGYDFYAVDLRKHGRSLRPHQTPNFCRDITDYFPEVDEAVRIIRDQDGHDTVLLNGHSTGGLVAALWANRRRGQGRVQALFLNSPFFDFRESWVVRRGLSRMVQRVGRRRPYATMPQRLGTVYGRSLHRDHDGEWHYDLAWKPLDGYPIKAGWVRAIAEAHRRVQGGLAIDVPVLVACSARTYRGRRFTEAAHHADAVLDVADMVRWSPGLGRHVTIVRVEGGKHDLTLSPPAARAHLFAELDRWLGTYLENRALAPVRPSQPGRTGAASGLAPQDAG
ncbi:MAG: alpha/beta hydrolase [Micromonosporaceae bacterium]